ncbi:MAG: gamma carbonic anhydrase family protein [Deferribacteres bacterium]|nr:gamma carbonic anhydrase family protein [candidate division KSB1 bacterium]MCB9511640.1 gamma carbonic anhydrase family protein [Deferribacteres bacterium]
MIHSHHNIDPKFGEKVFIAPNATVIGDVEIGEDSSIWFGVIMRGDVNIIRIGERSNIQDGTVLHVTLNKWPLHIGKGVSVGHAAMLHGCTVGDFALIGMRATVLDGAEIGEHAIVAAGAVVREGMKVPARTLVAGVPAVVKREVSQQEVDTQIVQAARYIRYKNEYLAMGMQHPALLRK